MSQANFATLDKLFQAHKGTPAGELIKDFLSLSAKVFAMPKVSLRPTVTTTCIVSLDAFPPLTLGASGQVDKMRKFVMMNTLAVIKITKKHDKHQARQLQQDMVRPPLRPSFHPYSSQFPFLASFTSSPSFFVTTPFLSPPSRAASQFCPNPDTLRNPSLLDYL